MRVELLDRIRRHVAEWSPAPVTVALFGSVARRDADARSDVDLLVVRALGDVANAVQVGGLADAVRRWTGNAAHVVDLTQDDLQRLVDADEPVVASWQADLEEVFGTWRLPSATRNARSDKEHGQVFGQGDL